MTAGEYTPAAVKAAPKRAPDAIERRILASMSLITLFDELTSDQIEYALALYCVALLELDRPLHSSLRYNKNTARE
jgi:hypothetical protein